MKEDKEAAFTVEVTDTDQYFKNIPHSLNAILESSVCRNWDRPSLSDYKGFTYTFANVAEMIAKLHLLFEAAGVKQGDKVALCGKNSSKWAIAFIACLLY